MIPSQIPYPRGPDNEGADLERRDAMQEIEADNMAALEADVSDG